MRATVALQGDAGKPRSALVIQLDHFIDLPTLVVLPLPSSVADLPMVRVAADPSAGSGLRERPQVMISRPQFLPRPQNLMISTGKKVARCAR
jgi:mRNA interferase MazF